MTSSVTLRLIVSNHEAFEKTFANAKAAWKRTDTADGHIDLVGLDGERVHVHFEKAVNKSAKHASSKDKSSKKSRARAYTPVTAAVASVGVVVAPCKSDVGTRFPWRRPSLTVCRSDASPPQQCVNQARQRADLGQPESG